MLVTEYLQQSDLFSRLTPEEVEQTAALGQDVVYNTDDVITREGEPADSIYVVCRGMVEVDISQDTIPEAHRPSQLTRAAYLGQGQLFGEMGLLARGVRSATVRCVQDGTTVFVIPREDFWTLCDVDHHIGYVLMRNIAVNLSNRLYLRNLQV